MALRRHINRLQQLDQLIRMKATGTPAQLAQKLGISESAWYKIRDELIQDFQYPYVIVRFENPISMIEESVNIEDFLWRKGGL